MRLSALFLAFRAFWAFAVFGLAGSPALASSDAQPAQRRPTQSESYVMVEPMYATIYTDHYPRGLLLVEIGLDVPDSDLRARVESGLPRLRDAYIRSLMVYASTTIRPFRQPDVTDIADRMQAITDVVVGRKGARVLMSQTAIRLTR